MNVLYNLFFVISTLFVGFQAALREGLHRFLLSLYQSLDNVVDMWLRIMGFMRRIGCIVERHAAMEPRAFDFGVP